MTKETALIQIQRLMQFYAENNNLWESRDFNEAQTRENFINGFFEALGWKVSGIPENMLPEERDVLVEYSLRAEEENTKSIDYVFKIRNRPQFIVEAKKPSESLNNPKHIFQAKSYAFLSKVPFVILTNFKEFKIYDISQKPHINQPHEDLIFSCSYTQYENQFEYLWDNFGKEAVISKSLISLFSQRRRKLDIDLETADYNYILKKGELLLDKTFLTDLEEIRLNLARGIFSETERELTEKELNEITQRLLDIIIFIRFLEDNVIENREHLREIITNENSNFLTLLRELCSRLNVKFNGLLFHDYPLFSNISINEEVVRRNILKLYYPESPYNFSKISIEILGRIFEQYLAKRITLTGGGLRLEVKPELRKAGGIYYTPEYIVDQILDETLNVDLSSKEPNEEFKISKILDFACGSGIFLIKAYKRLIKFCENNINVISEEKIFTDSLGKFHLTIEAKKELLQNNIFGIDIDSQAIEVTKMSLYFTMLEHFNEDNSPQPLLPSLESNLFTGNSIVDVSFSDDFPQSTIETLIKINPLSWEDEGLNNFDVIVGNPPYLRIQLLEELYPEEYHLYLKNKFSFAHSNFDLSVVFTEKAIKGLSETGKLGIIIPNTILRAKYGEKFREHISKEKLLSKIIHFNDYQVFENSTTYTCLFFLDKTQVTNPELQYVKVNNGEAAIINHTLLFETMPKSQLDYQPWYFSASKVHDDFLDTLNRNSFPLEELENLTKIFVGLQPSLNDVFVLEKVSENEDYIVCYSEAIKGNHIFEKELIKKMVKGSRNIFRYRVASNKRLLFPYITINNRSELISIEEFNETYPETWRYLNTCKDILQVKEALAGQDFYKYIYKKNHLLFENKKLLLPSLCLGSRFVLDLEGEYFFTGSGEGGGGGYGILLNDVISSYNYFNLLGILNSKIISAYIELRGKPKSGGYRGIDRTFIRNIPLPRIDNESKKNALREVGIKTERLNSLYLEEQNDTLRRITGRLENQINKHVLDLYSITVGEVRKLIEDLND